MTAAAQQEPHVMPPTGWSCDGRFPETIRE